MSAKKEWDAYQVARKIAAMWWPLRETHRTYYDSARAQARSFRRRFAPLNEVTKIATVADQTILEVKNAYHKMNASGYSRHGVVVKVGNVSGRKSKKNERWSSKTEHSLSVGWLWLRDVKKALYDNGFKSSLFLVLSANEIGVNYKYGKIYECQVYWKTDGKVDTQYIGEKTVGEKAFVYGHNASMTVRKLVALTDKEISKKMAGESNDWSRCKQDQRNP